MKKISEWANKKNYDAQTSIVKQALEHEEHSLDLLLELMRNEGQAALYVAGSRIDHDYCFGSKDVGMMFSVLPEDAEKAAEPGFHPGSTEVYVIFQGGLVMEYLENGQLRDKNVGQFDVIVLPPGRCHRVRFDSERKAASAIVKTNLNHEPGVLRCKNCTYYPPENEKNEDCPLYRSWQVEKHQNQSKPI